MRRYWSPRAVVLLGVSGCGGGDDAFKNEPRPPVPTQLTGVITEDEVTVSPDKLPLQAEAGQQASSSELDTPIVLIIANQTKAKHTVTLSGKAADGKPSRSGATPPIQPGDTAQIQQSLPPGIYDVQAGSEGAVDPDEVIPPATLTVNPNHQTSSDDLLLP